MVGGQKSVGGDFGVAANGKLQTNQQRAEDGGKLGEKLRCRRVEKLKTDFRQRQRFFNANVNEEK